MFARFWPTPASLQSNSEMSYDYYLQDRRVMARKHICSIRLFNGGSLPVPGSVN